MPTPIVTVERAETFENEDGRKYTRVKGFVDGVEKLELLWDGEITDEAVWEHRQGVVINYMTGEIRRRNLAEV